MWKDDSTIHNKIIDKENITNSNLKVIIGWLSLIYEFCKIFISTNEVKFSNM